jgi:hypothetical protein
MDYLDCLDGVFHLEKPPLWTESIDTSVIFTPRQEHCDLLNFPQAKRAVPLDQLPT